MARAPRSQAQFDKKYAQLRPRWMSAPPADAAAGGHLDSGAPAAPPLDADDAGAYGNGYGDVYGDDGHDGEAEGGAEWEVEPSGPPADAPLKPVLESDDDDDDSDDDGAAGARVPSRGCALRRAAVCFCACALGVLRLGARSAHVLCARA